MYRSVLKFILRKTFVLFCRIFLKKDSGAGVLLPLCFYSWILVKY